MSEQPTRAPGRAIVVVSMVAAVAVVWLFSQLVGLGGSSRPARPQPELRPEAETVTTVEPNRPPPTSTDPPANTEGGLGLPTGEVAVTSSAFGSAFTLGGQSRGLALLIPAEPKVIGLDLGTGEPIRLAQGGQTMVVDGSWVVLSDPTGVAVLTVADLSGEPLEVVGASPAQGWEVVESTEPGHVWIKESGPTSSARWALIELDTAEVVRTIQLPGPEGARWVAPGLVASPGGGTFQLRGDRFQPVYDGTIVTSSSRWAIGRRCRRPDQCVDQWLDPDSFTPVPGPVELDGSHDQLSPQGRWLYRFTDGPGVPTEDGHSGDIDSRLVDLDGQQQVVIPMASTPSFSPDERYIARLASPGVLAIYDSVDGIDYRVFDLPPTPVGLTLAWVELGVR